VKPSPAASNSPPDAGREARAEARAGRGCSGYGLLRGGDLLRRSAGQRRRRGFDAVEPRAIVPQDLAPLLVAERQAEELLDRLGERAVGVRIVARYDKISRAHLVDDIDR